MVELTIRFIIQSKFRTYQYFQSLTIKFDSFFEININCGHREGGPTSFLKKLKTPFFRDIERSFQEATTIHPEPHQFFSF